ncbi:RNA polymerase sigma-54 factor [Psychrobacter sp. TAE2020]|uniref:RNA polymerase factor sigma-54 n=1 Tax=Psychrobacter sp. TAE2020 TaxID=2846762 RepID=UPI001C1273DD|nr:RNA polymerase sigma-54 factor [Psychrobacter sp. TAE2020]MBU5616864.1 RNA polymerase sigma-54 factor [Psychrobacter sp. TAE2020]
MSMSFGLAATLSTSQKLTPQMQQAIKLLQLSSLELAQEVQAKLDNNPLLERVEDDEDSNEDDYELSLADECLTLEMWNEDSLAASATNDSDSSNTVNSADQQEIDSLDKLQQASIDNEAMDNSNDSYASLDSDNYDYSSVESSNYASAAGSTISYTGYDDPDSYQGSTSATIQDYVRWQLNFKRLSDTDTLIADYLVDSMDNMGFVRLDIEELLQSFQTMGSFYQWETQIQADEIVAVLRIIQSCDPLGVGARHLNECLNIQLQKLDTSTEFLAQAQALLKASEHLVSNNIKALTDITGLMPEEITPALNLLRTLNPAPGLAFQSRQPEYTQLPESYDIPDVLVTPLRRDVAAVNSSASSKTNQQLDSSQNNLAIIEGWHVRLNPDTLPKLRVNQEYANLVKRGDESPENQYLRDNLIDARLFIRSIEERNQNLLKVSTSIIYRQQAFLQYGAKAMQPLILKAIAEEVDLHESTVSRLTTSKTILTPQGLFSLKYFFSSHVSSSDGDVSSTAISAMIKQMITDEDMKKPLSDSRLQACLHEEGIDIARRTVAKYREALGIGSSTQRKQKY